MHMSRSVASTFGETRIPLPPSEIQCDWCCEMATSKIIDRYAYQGHQFACVVHGTEWYPHLFPESDTTPIETIIAEIPVGVTLAKSTDTNPLPYQSAMVAGHRNPLPWYPLHGHRPGLRANDLITLHSAFVILAMEGGTAHMSVTPEWETHPHQG